MMRSPPGLLDAIDQGHCTGFGRTGSRASPPVHGIVGLWEDEGDFPELLRTGRLGGLGRRELSQDETLVSGLNLVYSCERLHVLTYCEPEASLADFLAMAFLAWHDPAADSLDLLAPDSLGELLPRHARRYRELALPRPTDWCAEGYTGNIGRPLAGLTAFSGMHHVCDFEMDGMRCLDPLCHAEYAWVADGLCLFYMTAGVYPWTAWFYPFRA